jgi:hypothetical protein
MVVTFAHFAAPEAVAAAANVVLRLMTEDTSRDEQIVVHDVINEEVMASDIKLSGDQFEAIRMAVFLKYQALRAESGMDDEEEDDFEEHGDEGER